VGSIKQIFVMKITMQKSRLPHSLIHGGGHGGFRLLGWRAGHDAACSGAGANGSHRTPLSPQRPRHPSPVRWYPVVSVWVPGMNFAPSTFAAVA
jgi:hypothetical protein